MAERILSTQDVLGRTGLSRTTVWQLERDGTFPQRRKLVGNRVGWIESEVDAWIADRPVASASTPDEAA